MSDLAQSPFKRNIKIIRIKNLPQIENVYGLEINRSYPISTFKFKKKNSLTYLKAVDKLINRSYGETNGIILDGNVKSIPTNVKIKLNNKEIKIMSLANWENILKEEENIISIEHMSKIDYEEFNQFKIIIKDYFLWIKLKKSSKKLPYSETIDETIQLNRSFPISTLFFDKDDLELVSEIVNTLLENNKLSSKINLYFNNDKIGINKSDDVFKEMENLLKDENNILIIEHGSKESYNYFIRLQIVITPLVLENIYNTKYKNNTFF